jgi:chromosome segregation ATPase
LALLQTVDISRVEGGTAKIIGRIQTNDDKIDKYEDEIASIQREYECKCLEVANLKKQLLMESNKSQNSINSLEKVNFELQEKLKVAINESKQKSVYLSGKDNILEQMNEMLRKRDEKYGLLEEKYANLMVQYENRESENLSMTNLSFDLNSQIDDLKKQLKETDENLSLATLQKQQMQSTLNIWKLEYLNLSERYSCSFLKIL